MRRITLTIFILAIFMGGMNLLAQRRDVPAAATVSTPAADSLAARIARMPLEQKIGQLLIVGFRNPHLDEHIREMITKYRIGGINLLGRNVKSETQAKELIRGLHALNASSTDIPLFMATDQEGGIVSRFRFMKELTPQPDIATPIQAEAVAAARGKELRAIGINMNFAPLADYLTDPEGYLWDRVFHATPEEIAARAEAMLRGYRAAGIIPILKHFPGYGNLGADPHASSTALIAVDNTALTANLLPFRTLIERGKVQMLMTAHIQVPLIDAKPATVSPRFLTDILRTEWHYDGVIVTDDLEMASAGKDIGEVALDALRAGTDMLIITPTPAKQLAALSRIRDAVRTGKLSESRIDASLQRILTLKATLSSGR
ncbi:MAG: hypothetical protein HYY10_00585 [Candidatus Liptonbacteria bacterium]|nr:hypothetical protein [Candidatus Liptonbacteria bacterium]